MKVCFAPILPLTFDDSISYYEQLLKVNNKLSEVIDSINNFTSDVEAMVDSKIETLKDYVDSENAKQDLATDEKIEALRLEIEEKITTIYSYINNVDTVLRIFIKSEIAKLKDLIDELVIGEIYINDPTTGYNNKLNNVITNVYDALRYYGIEAYEFDSRQLTATEFDNKHITALRFDTLAKKLIGWIYEHVLYDPMSGLRDTIQRVFYRWVQVYRTDAITVNTFDEAEKTADEFSAYDMTALSFDESAKAVMIPS